MHSILQGGKTARLCFYAKGCATMEKIVIEGGKRLSGELRVHGSKNSALPILAAAVLTNKPCVIHNCPRLTDVDAAIRILTYLGCKVEREGNTVTIDATSIERSDIPDHLMREMRSSVVFLGPIWRGWARQACPHRAAVKLLEADRSASFRYAAIWRGDSGGAR